MNKRIVCAAIKLKTGTILCSPRHYDKLSYDLIMKYNIVTEGAVQGFVDQKGNFLTREEAYQIAEKEDQILRETPFTQCKKLDSEALY